MWATLLLIGVVGAQATTPTPGDLWLLQLLVCEEGECIPRQVGEAPTLEACRELDRELQATLPPLTGDEAILGFKTHATRCVNAREWALRKGR